MSKYFPERANVFIDDHIVTPLLAKDYEEADNITKSFNNKYDPEIASEYTYPTTLETNSQDDDGSSFKKYDEVKPRSCCELLKSAFMIILAIGNVTAWILSFVYSPYHNDWNAALVYVTGCLCLIATLMMIINERRILSYPQSKYTLICMSSLRFYMQALANPTPPISPLKC
jgi:uncharacterized membrane protein YcjF (UPF0283 family)